MSARPKLPYFVSAGIFRAVAHGAVFISGGLFWSGHWTFPLPLALAYVSFAVSDGFRMLYRKYEHNAKA